ncbi:MAG: glutamate-5-semialdehyde dehydrogenase [Chlamydiota bacterium]|nr:glutamate-5-semialdehyde dehydrogenase [Chlamydiota bacterium]
MAIHEMGEKAKKSSKNLALASTAQKNKVLETIARTLIEKKMEILKENEKDISNAKNQGLDHAMIDRLSLQGNRIEEVANDIQTVISLDDPIGEIIEEKKLPNGLDIKKRRTPIGVIGVIYESRPNVTIDIAALTIKTGNSSILRGGKETIFSNVILTDIIQSSLEKCGLPKDCVQLIHSPDKSYVQQLLKMHDHVDMIIPRGGAGLHTYCRDNSSIPVITGGIGICHLYVDESADVDKSISVIENAKIQRPTVCNALDTLLVNKAIAPKIISKLIKKLSSSNVSFKVDSNTKSFITDLKGDIELAKEEDWQTEWLSLTLGVKIVDTLDEAIDHITKYSSGHSDGIMTETPLNAEKFLNHIDSAAVYINASTRFTDGSQFGLGAEVAISTQKLHARGPMGLKELTTYRWEVVGDYHCRD